MLLALDTATRQAGLALYDGDHVRFECVWHNTDRFHTEWLVPAIEYALRQAGIRTNELKAVAVTKGPGSYTGIRVAMSVAKGLVAALGIPIIGINALDVVARPFLDGEDQVVCAAVPLGRGRFAYHYFHQYPGAAGDNNIAPPQAAVGNIQRIVEGLNEQFSGWPVKVVGEFTAEEKAQVVGDLSESVIFVPAPLALRRPSVLAMLAYDRMKHGYTDDPHTLEPIYLQP
jgi:tRNA threonylcarbamoyladenosine biosynthesis protein TsaB